jgi:hypothetical protein
MAVAVIASFLQLSNIDDTLWGCSEMVTLVRTLLTLNSEPGFAFGFSCLVLPSEFGWDST